MNGFCHIEKGLVNAEFLNVRGVFLKKLYQFFGVFQVDVYKRQDILCSSATVFTYSNSFVVMGILLLGVIIIRNTKKVIFIRNWTLTCGDTLGMIIKVCWIYLRVYPLIGKKR